MSKMYFGNTEHAQWVPCPATGAQRTRNRYSETMEFTNGGAWVDRSFGSHSAYSFNFPVDDSSEYTGIEAFDRFADGEYGARYLHFVDPMRSDENIMNETWAAPGLASIGHKRISDFPLSFVGTDVAKVTANGLPAQSAVYTIPLNYPAWTSNPDSSVRAKNSRFTILIPPGYVLHMGAVGSATGSGILGADVLHRTGGTQEAAMITLSGTPTFTQTFDGTLNKAVTLFVSHFDTVASTVTLTGIYAQVLPVGVTPTLNRHIPGKGHSGLSFSGGGRVETYLMADRHLVGASLELTEVEPWE
jgi:hypothetical protein